MTVHVGDVHPSFGHGRALSLPPSVACQAIRSEAGSVISVEPLR